MLLSKRNRRNLLLLLVILGVIIISPRVISNFYSPPKPVISFQEFQEYEKQFKEKRKQKPRHKTKKQKFRKLTIKTDPNSLLKEDWIKLGLSEKQTDIVLRFSERGLFSNDDLKKIFVFPEKLFELIKDSLVYPEKKIKNWEEGDFNPQVDRITEVIMVDVNTADSVILKTIPGIGPFYAVKIVEHRNNLGGFLSLNQLTEIWKFDEEKLTSIRKYSFLSNGNLIQMDINHVTIEALVKHPYISYKVANSIVKMREVNGSYTSIEDLMKSKLINHELFYKLEPYIRI